MTNHIHHIDGHLYVDEVDVSTMAQSVGTPFYCYSADAISEKFGAFSKAFEDLPSTICFAMKANSNQAVLTLLAKAGAGADVVSEGELRRALAAGIPAGKIVFSGVGKSRAEITLALENQILSINVESESELRLISEVAAELNVFGVLSVRINPDVEPKTHERLTTGKSGTKFGIPWESAMEFFDLAATLPNVRLEGIDTHIGSQITELASFDAAFYRMANLVKTLRHAGHKIDHVDLGGGLGISYQQNSNLDEITLLDNYATIVRKHFNDMDCHLIFEPGRFIVGNAGVLVTKVMHIKPTNEKHYIVVDAAMNDLVRPVMYDGWHEIVAVDQTKLDQCLIKSDIVGPVCEPGDFLAKDRDVPNFKQGDLLAVLSTGAYGAVFSNTYNTRLLIPEVLVRNEQFDVIRARPSFEDLLELDSIPDWLS